jgi:CubicO group peptidase (beta-lactamase class C family)
MADRKYLEGLEQVIADALELMNAPGVAVGIVENGEVVHAETYGYANIEEGMKLSKEHLMPIGSSGKAFTATSAVMLAADGLLDLDKPIREYLPGFRFYDEVATQQATARDLLCHRTGLPRHDDMWYGWEDLERKDIAMNRVRYLQPNKPFRSKWEYSNHMFALSGYLIEVVSGKTWEEFVIERIFGPLGITRYSFVHPRGFSTKEYATLYTAGADGVNRYTEPLRLPAMGPTGSIILTIEDYAKWAAFNASGGKIDGEQLVDPAYFAELSKPNISYELWPFAFEERFPVGYGLGWFVDSFRGRKLVEHGGNVPGATALLSFIPGTNTGCAILTNSNSSMLPLALASRIHDRMLGYGDEKDWFAEYDRNYKALLGEMMGALSAIFDTKVPDKPVSHDLQEYVGTYSNGGYGELSISEEDGELKLAYHGMDFTLDHLHYETFTFELMEHMYKPLTFRTNVAGQVDAVLVGFEMTLPNDPIVFTRVETVEKD